MAACGIGATTSSLQTTASTGGGATNPNGATSGNVVIPNHVGHYTLVGRFDQTDPNALVFSLPNSKIGFAFSGTSLALNFNELRVGSTDMFNVNIDGNTMVVTVGGDTTVMVGQNLDDGNHTVWVQKRTEFLQGQSGYVQFFPPTLGGTNAIFLTSPTTLSRRMEFIGDSGFTGYGVTQTMHSAADDCVYSVQTQDANQSIPADTAAALGAEMINVSSSGDGVYYSYYDPNNAGHLLPVMADETVPPLAARQWAVEDFPPQVIVISAGGDDLWGASGSGHFPNPDDSNASDPNAFVAAYAAWLAHLRTENPSALIVCVMSPAASGNDIVTLSTALQQAVAQEVGLGDTRVMYYSYFTNDANYTDYDSMAATYGYGCDYHPSAAGSLYLAQRLAASIQTEMTALGISW